MPSFELKDMQEIETAKDLKRFWTPQKNLWQYAVIVHASWLVVISHRRLQLNYVGIHINEFLYT